MHKRNSKELKKLNTLLQDFSPLILKRIRKKIKKKRKKILNSFDEI